MRKFAMLILFAMALAIGWGGLAPGLAPAAHAYPSGPCDSPDPW